MTKDPIFIEEGQKVVETVAKVSKAKKFLEKSMEQMGVLNLEKLKQ